MLMEAYSVKPCVFESDSRLEFEKDIAGYTVKYIRTTGYFNDSCDSAGFYEQGLPYYGVSLEKRDITGSITEMASCKGVTCDPAEAVRILTVLRDMEVTPMTFYEVIDTIVTAD